MKTVYLLQSVHCPRRRYVGVTSNLDLRLAQHNAGNCQPTMMHRPWKVEVAISFVDHSMALEFEQYLKSGSGREFSRRHFLPRSP